jgi:hypothetical protein
MRYTPRARLASVQMREPDEALAVWPFEIPQEPQFQMGGGGLFRAGLAEPCGPETGRQAGSDKAPLILLTHKPQAAHKDDKLV